MPSLNADFGFMYEFLLYATKFSRDRVYSFSSIVLHGKVFKTHTCIARTSKDEIWPAAQDHHIDTNIELSIRVQGRTIQIPLNNYSFEDSYLLLLLFLIRSL